jgi:SpoVK/Ycf46/Vps4 family AAA+-type ATPase
MTMARRIEPRTSLIFDDLILPGPNKRQLEELRLRVRNRSRVYTGLGFEQRLSLGKGLIALFTGSSGTGKTMAAELLACEQGVDLYKVDLSAVVSKYVGETEKNLSQVFAEAEDANAIIFFDEADALFGKRGEVKEARDRWANIEINYLLQRIEEYVGVVIMASNLRQNIDEAFLRRIHVIVDFPFPDALARLQIWKGLFPQGLAYPPDQELRILADRFNLSGGSLKNIAIDAGFRALAESLRERPAITLRHLVASTGREYQKLGKPITRSEFGEKFYNWVEEDILA